MTVSLVASLRCVLLRMALVWALSGAVVNLGLRAQETPQLRYSLPDHRSKSIGKRELETLQNKADDEGFLDVLLGSNCYSSAVRSLQQDCNRMDSDSSMLLAFSMANCLFAKTGRPTYPCKSYSIQDIASCTARMNGEDYVVFSQFLQNVHTMCVFVANSDFQHRAEAMLNNLYATGSVASEQAVQQQAAAVDELGAGIGNVAEGQQKLLEDVSESMVQLTQLQEVAQSVEQGMRESQALHEHLIESERQVTRQLTNLEALHSEHATEVHKTWQMIEDQAKWYMEWQGDSLALNNKITESAAAMAHASEGIRTATHFFETAQHRSQHALAVLVGRQFSHSDAVFMAGSLVTFIAMGWHHATQHKRLAFVVSVALTVALERSIVSCLAPWQRLGIDGAAVVQFPEYLTWLLWWCGTPSVEHVKSCVRVTAAVGMLSVMLHALWVHQDAPQMLQRVFSKLESLEQQQTARWNLLHTQLLHTLASLQGTVPNFTDPSLEADASEIARRRKREQLRLEEMWQEALAVGQPEGGTPSRLITPLTIPGSSSVAKLDSSTPLPNKHMHAIKASCPAVGANHAKNSAKKTPQGGKEKRTSGKDPGSGHFKQDEQKDTAPGRTTRGALPEKKADQQVNASSCKQKSAPTRKLEVRVTADSVPDSTGEGLEDGRASPRRSPRGVKGASKRPGSHNDADSEDDGMEGGRAEKKLRMCV